MSGYQIENLADAVATTLNKLDKGKFTDLTSDLQDHVGMREILTGKKISYQSGLKIQFQAMTDHNNSARAVRLMEEDEVRIATVMTRGYVPWRHVVAGYGYDLREIAMCRGEAEIVSLLKQRKASMGVAIAEKMEEYVWSCPVAADDVTPFGIPSYVVKNATQGFNGGAPSDWTTVAELNPTTLARWKNYTDTYADFTDEDLFSKMGRAATFTKFRSPVPMEEHSFGRGRGVYTNYDVLGPMEQACRQQNDNLTNELQMYHGKVMFLGSPVTWVPYLEADTQNPVYILDYDTIRPVFLSGFFMAEGAPRPTDDAHLVYAAFSDTSFNFVCTNRRKQSVIYQA